MESNKEKLYLLGTSKTTPGIGTALFEIINSIPNAKAFTVMQIYVNDKNEVVKGEELKLEYWYHGTTMTMAVNPSIAMTLLEVGPEVILEELTIIYQQKVAEKEEEITEIKKKIPTSLDNL